MYVSKVSMESGKFFFYFLATHWLPVNTLSSFQSMKHLLKNQNFFSQLLFLCFQLFQLLRMITLPMIVHIRTGIKRLITKGATIQSTAQMRCQMLLQPNRPLKCLLTILARILSLIIMHIVHVPLQCILRWTLLVAQLAHMRSNRVVFVLHVPLQPALIWQHLLTNWTLFSIAAHHVQALIVDEEVVFAFEAFRANIAHGRVLSLVTLTHMKG